MSSSASTSVSEPERSSAGLDRRFRHDRVRSGFGGVSLSSCFGRVTTLSGELESRWRLDADASRESE